MKVTQRVKARPWPPEKALKVGPSMLLTTVWGSRGVEDADGFKVDGPMVTAAGELLFQGEVEAVIIGEAAGVVRPTRC